MSRNVVSVLPDDPILKAVTVLLDHGISGAPVVSENDELVGMLTEKDCMSFLINSRFYGTTAGFVRDYMTTDVFTVAPETDIFAIADYFLNQSFRRLPVLREDGHLVGIVSRRDVLRASRRIWDQFADCPPDSGYLSEKLKARLGSDGVAKIHRVINLS